MSSEQAASVRPKPAIAYAIQTVAAFLALANSAYAIYAVSQFGKLGAMVLGGTFLVSTLVAVASIRVFLGLSSRPFKSRVPVSLYLWAMLFLYPVTYLLRSLGAFSPAPYVESDQLFGAWIMEMGRYALFPILIVWVAISKRLVSFLATR